MAPVKHIDPMSFKARLAIALRLLDAKGIRRWTYYISIYQLLWLLNVSIRPPIFNGFVFNCVFMSIAFGTLWGTFMWFLLWSRQGMAITTAVMLAAAAGVFFGIVLALLTRHKARKLGLPAWEQLSSEAEDFE
jgi:hypothetical protein